MPEARLDRLISGGRIYAGGLRSERVEAIGIVGGEVVATGPLPLLEPLCDDETIRHDLKGNCVVPGFLDPHTHFSLSSFTPSMADCRTPPLRSLDDVLAAMQQRAAHTEAGRWVVGWGYEENLLKEGRHPRVQELDCACPAHPAILLHVSLHQCVVNSIGLALCGIDRSTPDPFGGEIERDWFGYPGGLLRENAAMPPFLMAYRDLMFREEDETVRLFGENAERFARMGIVRLADAAVGPLQEELYRRAASAGAIPIPVDRMVVGGEGIFSPPVEIVRRKAGPDRPVVKVFLDGAERCAVEISPAEAVEGMARLARRAVRDGVARRGLRNLFQPHATVDRAGRIRLGLYLNDPAEMEELVHEAHRQGYPVAAHALGNAAVRRMLEIYRQARDRYGPPRVPFRLEHTLFLRDEQILRMAELRVAAVVQPAFLYQYGNMLQAQPLPRGLRTLPLRRMIDAGVLVAGSSDGPCAPEDPLLGMDCAMRRASLSGACLDPDQAIGAEEALAMYTRNAAAVMGCDDVQGSLEAGKRADLLVLSADPFAEGFRHVHVVETVVGGRTVWDATSASLTEEKAFG